MLQSSLTHVQRHRQQQLLAAQSRAPPPAKSFPANFVPGSRPSAPPPPPCVNAEDMDDVIRRLQVSVHTSHVLRHMSHVTCHMSHVTRHTSHVARHTSHFTCHTSHVTRHTSSLMQAIVQRQQSSVANKKEHMDVAQVCEGVVQLYSYYGS